MVTGLIIAGGVGSRMGAGIPKQFMDAAGKPVIIYTLLAFEKNPNIDNVCVVCVKGWEDKLKVMIKEFSITKVKWIVPGGNSSHGSIKNGVYFLNKQLKSGDIVIIHDAVRPIVPQIMLNELIAETIKHKMVCTAIPCYETIIATEDGKCGNVQIDRSSIMRVQTPQAYNIELLYSGYKKAEEQSKEKYIYTNTMLIDQGNTIYFSRGFVNNIKVTTPNDVPLLESLLEYDEKDLMRI